MNKKKLFFLILLVISIISTGVYAKDKLPNATNEFYIYDEANIIDRNVKDYIVNTNKYIYENTGAQIVVATVDSLGNIDKNSYATAIFKKWEIGSRKHDNGMLILIAPNDGEIWIEVGYGLEGPFPDSITKRIIEDHMIPYFQEERYSEGVLAGFNQVLLGLEKEYNISLDNKKEIENPIPVASTGSPFLRILMVIAIIIFLIIDFSFFRGMITYSLLRSIGRGSGGGRGGGSSGGGGRSGGGGAGGSW